MSEISSPLLASLTGFAPGAVGGCLNCIVGHPLDLIKVRMQTATVRKPALSMLRNVAMTEGLAGLYAGVLAPLLAVVPAFAVTFWTYDTVASMQMKRSKLEKRDELSISQVALAGGASGVSFGLVVGPLERFKCLMQVSKYDSFLQCVRTVYQQEGLRGVFRGTPATILRDVPGNAAYFGAYEFSKREIERHVDAGILSTLLAGGIAGSMNWLVAIPFDVVKSKMQVAPPNTYNGMFHVLQHTLSTEGPSALFRGLGPALMRAFPANAACLLGVETARSLLSSAR